MTDLRQGTGTIDDPIIMKLGFVQNGKWYEIGGTGGGGSVNNVVTLDTIQTITAEKNFNILKTNYKLNISNINTDEVLNIENTKELVQDMFKNLNNNFVTDLNDTEYTITVDNTTGTSYAMLSGMLLYSNNRLYPKYHQIANPGYVIFTTDTITKSTAKTGLADYITQPNELKVKINQSSVYSSYSLIKSIICNGTQPTAYDSWLSGAVSRLDTITITVYKAKLTKLSFQNGTLLENKYEDRFSKKIEVSIESLPKTYFTKEFSIKEPVNVIFDDVDTTPSITLPEASEKQKGVIQIATQKDILNGTDKTKAVTPGYLPNLLRPVEDNLTFYVSNSGDDTTADGTQEKPFKDLQLCYNYIAKNYFFYKVSTFILIKFLTDYTYNKPLITHPIVGNSSLNYCYPILDGSGFEVKLIRVHVPSLGVLKLKNITFIPDNDNDTKVDTFGGCIILEKTTMDLTDETFNRTLIRSRYSGYVAVIGLNIISNSPKSISTVYLTYTQGLIHLYDTHNFGNNITCNQFLSVTSNARLCIDSRVTFSGSVTGKKYLIESGGVLDIGNRGPEIIPATLQGTNTNNEGFIY